MAPGLGGHGHSRRRACSHHSESPVCHRTPRSTYVQGRIVIWASCSMSCMTYCSCWSWRARCCQPLRPAAALPCLAYLQHCRSWRPTTYDIQNIYRDFWIPSGLSTGAISASRQTIHAYIGGNGTFYDLAHYGFIAGGQYIQLLGWQSERDIFYTKSLVLKANELLHSSDSFIVQGDVENTTPDDSIEA